MKQYFFSVQLWNRKSVGQVPVLAPNLKRTFLAAEDATTYTQIGLKQMQQVQASVKCDKSTAFSKHHYIHNGG